MFQSHKQPTNAERILRTRVSIQRHQKEDTDGDDHIFRCLADNLADLRDAYDIAASARMTFDAVATDYDVILTGLTTSGCVRATCVDSMSHGFITTVVRDACGDRHPAPHDANLFDINAKYADVVSLTDIIEFIETL